MTTVSSLTRPFRGGPGAARPCDASGMVALGRIEVISGPMFAGKTEELLRRVRRAVIAGRRVTVIGHLLDERRGTDRLTSHAGLDHPSIAVSSAAGISAAAVVRATPRRQCSCWIQSGGTRPAGPGTG